MDVEEENVDDPGPGCSKDADSSNKRQKKKQGEENVKRAATQKPKVFQEKWLEDPTFRGWLARVPQKDNLARCLCCSKDLKCGKSELQKHASNPSHKKAAAGFKGLRSIGDAFAAPKKSAQQTHTEDVKRMEIGLSAYFAEHNVAFTNAEHLVSTIKRGAKDSEIVKDVKLGRKKCTAIVTNVIAKTETEELVKNLAENEFSVMIDESTDIANRKQLCILVRYCLPTSFKPETALLELVELDARDCSGSALWRAFKECLENHGIPVKNVVGLGCDNASVMVGKNDSFWTRLKAECSWAILIPCICHSSAIVSRLACGVLPSFVENHLRAVSTYMNMSPKRSTELKDFQELYEEEISKILKPSGTRWLVMQTVVQRYLKHYDSLYGFFRTTVRETPKDKEAQNILNDMNNIFTKAYMFFLEYALTFFNEFNALFQSRDVLIHKLCDSSRILLKKFCQNFIQPRELNRLDTANVIHPSNFLPIEEIYLGPACNKYLDTLQIPESAGAGGRKKRPEELAKELAEIKKTFRLKCLEFYSTAATEIKARLPKGKLFSEMAFLDPALAFSAEARVSTLPDLETLASNFQERLGLDMNALAVEWRTMPSEIDGALRTKLLSVPVAEVWGEINSLKNYSNGKVFPQLSRLARCILALPHSNAEAERAFSIVTDAKTKKRNKLGQDSLNAIVVTRSSFANKGVHCFNFPIKKVHLDKFNSSIYEKND